MRIGLTNFIEGEIRKKRNFRVEQPLKNLLGLFGQRIGFGEVFNSTGL